MASADPAATPAAGADGGCPPRGDGRGGGGGRVKGRGMGRCRRRSCLSPLRPAAAVRRSQRWGWRQVTGARPTEAAAPLAAAVTDARPPRRWSTAVAGGGGVGGVLGRPRGGPWRRTLVARPGRWWRSRRWRQSTPGDPLTDPKRPSPQGEVSYPTRSVYRQRVAAGTVAAGRLRDQVKRESCGKAAALSAIGTRVTLQCSGVPAIRYPFLPQGVSDVDGVKTTRQMTRLSSRPLFRHSLARS